MMNEIEFRSYRKIPHIAHLEMSITQKLHGTNAQIYIDENEIKAGSRSKWLSPGKGTDNYGFASFVEANKDLLREKLGNGRHYGEWCGPGINSGEGLSSKQLYLFNWKNHVNQMELYKPHCIIENLVYTVPVLYQGIPDKEQIDSAMARLNCYGSCISDYRYPEGIVVHIGTDFYKMVFVREEIPWKKKENKNHEKPSIEIGHLLQPKRLEKLLSRDESYRTNYPESLPKIAKDYVTDLIEESQISGDEDQQKEIRKSLGKKLFYFIKEEMNDLSN